MAGQEKLPDDTEGKETMNFDEAAEESRKGLEVSRTYHMRRFNVANWCLMPYYPLFANPDYGFLFHRDPIEIKDGVVVKPPVELYDDEEMKP